MRSGSVARKRLTKQINQTFWFVVALSTITGVIFLPLIAQQDSKSVAEGPLVQVAQELYPADGPVRFHREDQLEDSLDSGRKDSDSIPRIYRIEALPFDRSGPTMTMRVPSGLPTMFVAISSDGRIVYRLYGFQGAEHNFNRLVKDSQLAYSQSEQGAEARGLFCAEAVYGLSPKWWVNGASGVKLKAAQHFFDSGHEDGLTLGAKWWKSAKGDRTSLSISTTRSGTDYVLRIPVFWDAVESHVNPEVRLYSISVTETGSCLMPSGPVIILK
jgi:hypothetical protein